MTTHDLALKEQWYESLIEDCKSIITETVFNSRWALVEGYHALGARVLEEHDNFERSKIYGADILQRVAKSLGKSHRTIDYAVQFARQFPDLDALPGGKNVSWRKICNEVLPQPKSMTPELPVGKYAVIAADPAWRYWESGEKNQSRHYATMSLDDIKALPVATIAAPDCALFLWVTGPILQESFDVITAWGFSYSTIAFTWVKKNKKSESFFFGNGAWTRANAELCLLATKGRPARADASVSQIIHTTIEEHSRKPDEVYDKIVQLMGNVPRVELFAREHRSGWDVWGNEI